ncbi:MAG: peptidase domain-containing ABC transporter [Flavipsychrobacter sp.]
MKRFKYYKQHDAADCGPTCLRMVARYYGKDINISKLRSLAGINKTGVSLLGISNAAESIGFKTVGAKVEIDYLLEESTSPSILYWMNNHFVVFIKTTNNGKSILIADPNAGMITIDKTTFSESWLVEENKGIALFLEPTSDFYNLTIEQPRKVWSYIASYASKHRAYFIQLLLGLAIGSVAQVLFPFFTQSIADRAINAKDVGFLQIIIIAQTVLFITRTAVDFIRSRILLFISTNINISLLSGFWSKLMKLPISYFDTKQTGDIFQRLSDHSKIEQILTGASLSVLFSVISFFIFSVSLFNYNSTVFYVAIFGSILNVIWVSGFLKYRKELNYKQFSASSTNSSTVMQLINGMQEIKMHNAENYFRWNWEKVQSKIYHLRFKSLSLSQIQQSGTLFINESKNIFITFWVALLVIDNKLTFGGMLAIQYIIGQLTSPFEYINTLLQSFQDAKISIDRLSEIHEIPDEESSHNSIATLPENKTITIRNLSYSYDKINPCYVLDDVSLIIPENKTTAIVGMSGSGKTTLLKLLLKFYEDYTGDIRIGNSNPSDLVCGSETIYNLKGISPGYWRGKCGIVMQEGYIFNDTIEKNIAVGQDVVDAVRLQYACMIANIEDYINSLPLGFNTKIGSEGNGLSQGQKQRILIARVAYKNPEYIFFDEATNSLDANNEKTILKNLQTFFINKTVVVVAHRLSTVKNADNIIVLHNGKIVETGNHNALVSRYGYYYNLVKNQLELEK